jgi:molybdopterin converting factor small subunit
MADLLPGAAVAVNLDYAQRQVILRDGDELALIPPVSGG